ncbi:MAG: aconitase family protein [Myxococcota bacterium]
MNLKPFRFAASALGDYVADMAAPESRVFGGRILYLASDPRLLEAQLDGETLAEPPELLSAISTDEIAPGWVCFHYDEVLGRHTMRGLRGSRIGEGAIQDGGFEVLVAGESMGCGSSREQAPFSQLAAGIRLVIAHSFEKIYRQNCQNIGLLTSTDFGLLPRIARGEAICLDEFTCGLDPISCAIVRAGGLFAYNKQRMSFGQPAPLHVDTNESAAAPSGNAAPPDNAALPGNAAASSAESGRAEFQATGGKTRPMTLVEKIIASHAVVDPVRGVVGMASVAPGDALFVKTDVRFSHEYVTPMAAALFEDALGKEARVRDPESVYLFSDHLTHLHESISPEKKALGLLDQARGLARIQTEFSKKNGLRLYGELDEGGAEAICHNAIVEDLALPGQLVTGTDSHSCMAGVLGAFAFGIGSTDMANAWFTGDVRLTVPETLRFELRGRLREGVAAKDVMLYILSKPFFRTSQGIGKVLEFGGTGLQSLSIDERATLTNMAVEAGGFTGIIEADARVFDYLRSRRSKPVPERPLKSDPDAEYLDSFSIDLEAISPMVATPGDPRNGVPLASLDPVPIEIAYGGSCTGGKMADMDMYAAVFRAALAQGKAIPKQVQCFIQYGSQAIRHYAVKAGHEAVFLEVGARVIQPSCGACINAGPGASKNPNQRTVSAQNRNFPGRSGPGQVYLASPYTVAASAIAGHLTPATVTR